MSTEGFDLEKHAARRAHAIEALAIRSLNPEVRLHVGKRRRDGSVISYKWMGLHVRAEHVEARAAQLRHATPA